MFGDLVDLWPAVLVHLRRAAIPASGVLLGLAYAMAPTARANPAVALIALLVLTAALVALLQQTLP